MDCNEDTDTRYIRVLPDTCVELFINYTTPPLAIIGNALYKRSIITFRMSQATDVHMRKGAGVIAICFYPGMAYRFFSHPMHAFSNTTTALSDVWQNKAAEIEEKVAAATNAATRIAIVQQYLVQLLAHGKEDQQVAHCLQLAAECTTPLSVQQLTESTGISQRQLSRKFQEYVGLSPKAYLGVTRFVRSLQHLKNYPAQSLTQIAYESGYYDQAHFIRDYSTYAGHTPREVAQSPHILY